MLVKPDSPSSQDPHAGKNAYSTPLGLYNFLNQEFNFTMDGAAQKSNALHTNYIGLGGIVDDYLDFKAVTNALGPAERIFLNPPYGKGFINEFLKRSDDYRCICSATVVALLPVAPTSMWWQRFVHIKANEVRFLRKRLKFGGATHGAMFDSCIAVYRPTPWISNFGLPTYMYSNYKDDNGQSTKKS